MYPGVQRGTSQMAIWALVCSIFGIFCCGCFVLSVVGLALGLNARGTIRQSHGMVGGDGMALAAVVISCVGLGLGVLNIVLSLFGHGYFHYSAHTFSSSNTP